jgi:GntR family transcriptional regulator
MRNSSAVSWKVNRTSEIPLHRQIEERLLELSRIPKYMEGELFPDELTLADRFGVSRGTVRNGIMNLVRQGILERRAGVGTRVVHKATESGYIAWRSFSREMKMRGIEVQLLFFAITVSKARTLVAQALKLAEGTSVLRLDRVRGWNGRAIQHCRIWFHPRLALTEDQDFARPLYELIQDVSGIEAARTYEELKVVRADAEISRRLKLSQETPLLLRRQTTYDINWRPIDYQETHHCTDHFPLTFDLQRMDPH